MNKANMKKLNVLLSIVILLGSAGICGAESTGDDIWSRETLTNGFFGLGNSLADNGIEIGFSVTNIYQQNVHGGISTHRRAGRLSGSYDLELSADMQKLLGIEGGNLFVHAEGLWSKSGGVDGPSVGSVFGVNGDAGDRRSIDVTEFWYEQSMFEGVLLLRVGKMDLTGGFECQGCPVAFDSSTFANDETNQFLNGALVNNITIPFPDYALGIAAFYNPVDWWYAAAGVVDAQNDARETGFSTTFHDEDYFFYIFETGVTTQFDSENGPLRGAYRIGLWYDPQDKEYFSDSSKSKRDDAGYYVSCDQLLCKENSDVDDSQGLGIFARYGWADDKVNEVANFWSAGLQYQGLFEGRDDDILALGFAQGTFSNKAVSDFQEDYESVTELYYNAHISPWLNVSPSIQYIANPGGAKGVSDAVVFGVRVQMVF